MQTGLSHWLFQLHYHHKVSSLKGFILKRYHQIVVTIHHLTKVSSKWCHHPQKVLSSKGISIVRPPSSKGIIPKRYHHYDVTIPHPIIISSLSLVAGLPPWLLSWVQPTKASQRLPKGFPTPKPRCFLLDKRINRISYQTRSKTEFLIRQEAYKSFLFDRKLIRNAHQMRNHQWNLISSAVFELSILALLLLELLIIAALQVCCSSKKLTDSAAGSRSWPPGGACSGKFFACIPIERLRLRARALKILRFI